MTTNRLLEAALTLTGQLDLPDVLQDFVDLSAELTGARYSAMGVLDNLGRTALFVHHGMDDRIERLIGHAPHGDGLFAEIPVDRPLILDDLTDHPAFSGFPAGHPPMGSFLGVSVRIDEQVFGRLYLADSPGGFTPEDATQVEYLARAAGIAIANSRVYGESRKRERWMQVSQEITTSLLEGTEEEEALQFIAQRVREVADADTCLIVLPSVGESWACEISDGYLAPELIGVEFPNNGRALTVLREGVGVIVDSLARAHSVRVPILRRFGPAMYAPMIVRRSGLGIILLLRAVGRPEFEPADLTMAEGLAQQAALALELAAVRHADDVSNLLAERQRIGRDLHDLAIQQLFATGMQLHSARTQLAERGEDRLADLMEQSLTSVDESVRQIRVIVQSLREAGEAIVLVERLRRETSIGRTALGFAPSLVFNVDGEILDDDECNPLVDEVDARVDVDIADDLVAVVREGLANAARHARATSVQVRVIVRGRGALGRVSVEVEDDGRGVDPEVSRRSGLDNLAARARRHHGEFTLTPTESGDGSILSWQVPLT
ncbi:MAG: GAF domain-containing protein [Ruaniaceae bacterium]|nr:GAF domain-containing protein [Ruaniaceae bacterium]